jgi:tRNA (guanine-N7-)-methyltransferase
MRRLSPGCLAGLHVYFPDPWPKKRHHKRRLVDTAWAEAAARALAPGCVLRVASDHEEYFALIDEVLSSEPLLEKLRPEEAGDWSTGSSYELKFKKTGRPIYKAVFRRRASGSGS